MIFWSVLEWLMTRIFWRVRKKGYGGGLGLSNKLIFLACESESFMDYNQYMSLFI